MSALTKPTAASERLAIEGGTPEGVLQIAGKLQRQGSSIKVRHIAEVLAGQGGDTAIGEPAK